MSAAESRELLEYAIRQALATCHVRGVTKCGCNANVDAILSLADMHALARVQEAVQAGVQAELERISQARRIAILDAQRATPKGCGTIAAARRHRRHGDVPPGKKLRDVCPVCADAEVIEYRERTGRPA